jgi:hypothetical protein
VNDTPVPFPGFDHFWSVSGSEIPHCFHGWLHAGDGRRLDQREIWDIASASAPTPPSLQALRIPGPSRLSDIVWTSGFSIAISPKAFEIFSPYSGWAPFPLPIVVNEDQVESSYVGVAIHGKCGRMTATLTAVEGIGAQADYVGKEFPPESWDGSDIFFPRRGRTLIVTQPFRGALVRAKLHPLAFERLPEVRQVKASVDRMIANRLGPYTLEPDN